MPHLGRLSTSCAPDSSKIDGLLGGKRRWSHSPDCSKGIRKSADKGNSKLKIVILGPDGAGKSSVIDGLMSILECGGRTVKTRHLKPRYVARLRDQPEEIVVDPHGKPPRGVTLSLVKIFVWLVEEWYYVLFHEKRGTVLIFDRYYHDLLVDPRRYRFGAPQWTAEMIGKLMPRPKLWILLDAPAAVLQARKQEVAAEETARQCRAYLSFVKRQRCYAIVDASEPLDRVIAVTAHAIEAALTEEKGDRG